MATNLPEYTDLKRTRVAQPRRGEHARARLDEQMGNTQPINMKEGLLDGLSVPQLVAGAAAAATSMLLASKIGLAGSVIGAAVSSVVTVVATQLYRRALMVGARKIKTLDPGHTTLGEPTDTNPYGRLNRTTSTRIAPEGYRMDAAVPGARVAPNILQARAAEQRAAVQRKVILASVGVAVLAVAICAGAVLLATAGEGLGDRPASVVQVLGGGTNEQAETPSDPTAEPSSDDAATTDSNTTSSDSTSSNGAASSSANSNATGNSSSSTSQSNSNSSTGANGNQGSSTSGSTPSGSTSSTDSSSKNDGSTADSTQTGTGATSGNDAANSTGTDSTGATK